MNATPDRIYEFSPYRLETAERLLLRDGKPVALTPKAFETLLVLVRRSGHVVRKDDLMSQVWPDAVVEEANLARNVWTLRKALGDDNGEAKYIETIPKLGYRFVASVTELTAEAVENPPAVGEALPAATRRFRPFALTLVALVAVGVLSVGLIQSWRSPASAPLASAGATFLTDGSHDDVGASWNGDGRIYFSRAV